MTFSLIANLPLPAVIAGFLICTLIIASAGAQLAKRCDVIADRTGWGEALVGAVLLGAATSLPGIITSVATAAQGFPALSSSNAVGGIAVQTAFLAIADLVYRRANLEHAAASLANITEGALLLAMLAIPLVTYSGPDFTIAGIHPSTIVMLAAYGFGLQLVRRARTAPMWTPEMTRETQEDEAEGAPEENGETPGAPPWTSFALLALLTGLAGFGISQFAVVLADRTPLSEVAIGGLFTAIATSLPELVTSIAAVRRGALTLAVGGILGGNAFDTLFLSLSDIAYRGGSLYHAMPTGAVFTISMSILMTAVLMLGLLRRQRVGFAGIGFESALILAFYAVTVGVLFF
jgi:cation:H+ antiporter